MSRGVIYYIWGNKIDVNLNNSIKSVEKFGYKYEIIRDNSNYKGFRKRIGIFDKSPFETTLYLDTDTQICDNVDFGFEMAEKYGIACSIAPAASAYDALKLHNNELLKEIPKDLIQYNCGVLFFNKEAKKTFNLWSELMLKYSESENNDQPYFSYAVYKTINPYVLSKNWNYRKHLKYVGNLHGKLKILHSRI